MKNVISTTSAPGAVGPYSQGIKTDSLIFVSGQMPIDPATGAVPEGIGEQTKQCLKNIESILKEGGSSLANVVKTVIFLADMNDFAVVNEEYAKVFAGSDFPARSCVEVAKLPKDMPIEIEVIATV